MTIEDVVADVTNPGSSLAPPPREIAGDFFGFSFSFDILPPLMKSISSFRKSKIQKSVLRSKISEKPFTNSSLVQSSASRMVYRRSKSVASEWQDLRSIKITFHSSLFLAQFSSTFLKRWKTLNLPSRACISLQSIRFREISSKKWYKKGKNYLKNQGER